MNGVDLNLFRFEYDLTWMAFFMDAADHFYARYGGREDAGAESHLTQKSLARTMRQALDLHARKAVLKTRSKPRPKTFRTPEEIPPPGPATWVDGLQEGSRLRRQSPARWRVNSR